MAEKLARCSTGIIRLFCVVFGPNAGDKNRRYHNIFFEALFAKVFCTNARMLRGCKAILIIFISHSLSSFGSWEIFLDFEWFFPDVHCELETKTVSNFPYFSCSTIACVAGGIVNAREIKVLETEPTSERRSRQENGERDFTSFISHHHPTIFRQFSDNELTIFSPV